MTTSSPMPKKIGFKGKKDSSIIPYSIPIYATDPTIGKLKAIKNIIAFVFFVLYVLNAAIKAKIKTQKTNIMERNVVAKNTSIVGDIISQGDFRIDGSLDGSDTSGVPTSIYGTDFPTIIGAVAACLFNTVGFILCILVK